MRILLRIPDALILWDFDFIRVLAAVRLDGFSIGRYEENRESFDLMLRGLKAERCDFLGKIARALELFQNKVSTLVLL